MARWKAHVLVKNMGFKNMNMNSFLLSVIELLFLSLAVEVLKAKRFKTCYLQEGLGHLEPRFQGKWSPPVNILIPLERQLIALQLCR